jgi:hypothetical protein
MIYSEIRTQFKAILNRRDCTDGLADTFLDQALIRCSRELRITGQEVYDSYTVVNPFVGYAVPADIKQLIALTVTTTDGKERKISPMPLSRFLELETEATGVPEFYCRIDGYFKFKPVPPVDTVLNLYYYGEHEAFTGDNDSTPLSLIASDLLIYAALSYASDYFMDDRGQAFEGRYEQIKQAVQDEAYDLEAHDAVISSPYSIEY